MKNPLLLVAFAMALGFAACSDDDSSSSASTIDSYIGAESSDASASSDSMDSDSDATDSPDSDDLASSESGSSSSAASSASDASAADSESSSSESDSGEGSSSAGEASSETSSAADEEASSSAEASSEASSSAEASSSGEITLSVVILVGSSTASDSTTIPAGEAVYATIEESASETCFMYCSTLSSSTITGDVTLSVDGEEYTGEEYASSGTTTLYSLWIQLDSPCAGETYVMSATADILCFMLN